MTTEMGKATGQLAKTATHVSRIVASVGLAAAMAFAVALFGLTTPAMADDSLGLSTASALATANDADREVMSIGFKPSAEIVLIYEYDDAGNPSGTEQVDSEGNQYFQYDLPGFNAGDVISVTYSNDETIDYTLTYVTSGNSRWLEWQAKGHTPSTLSDVSVSSDQDVKHWMLGNDNWMTVSYAGKSCKARVSVKHFIGAASVTYKADPTCSWKEFTWNGKAKKPAMTVAYRGKTLTAGKDYTLRYVNNKNITADGCFVVTGIGDSWTGVMDGRYNEEYNWPRFSVVPKGTSITKVAGAKKAVVVQWRKQATKMPNKRIAGYQVQVAKNAKFKGAKEVNVKGYEKTSKKISGLVANKKHYVRVRTCYTVNEGGWNRPVYSKWSKAKTVKTRS